VIGVTLGADSSNGLHRIGWFVKLQVSKVPVCCSSVFSKIKPRYFCSSHHLCRSWFFHITKLQIFPKFIEFGISCNVKTPRTTKMMTTAKITWPNLEIKHCYSKLELLKTNHIKFIEKMQTIWWITLRWTTLRRYFK
jgi:hypothetical protein